ncbi:MAG TPA: 2Fe-2S iron-sulfur cluster-binding protein [Actinophytocola sp.]|jgi:hypothetical protein|nr:2Fe-2S iron-sulfur cluster-binding protein [Actinophytocola sp.]
MATVADEALLLALLNSAPVVDGVARDALAEHAPEHAAVSAVGLREARAGLAAVVRREAPPASLAPLLDGVVGRPVLELAEACDVPTRWSCRTGVCHTCVTPVLSGSVVHDPAPLEPPAPGEALICCARPATDLILDL